MGNASGTNQRHSLDDVDDVTERILLGDQRDFDLHEAGDGPGDADGADEGREGRTNGDVQTRGADQDRGGEKEKGRRRNTT